MSSTPPRSGTSFGAPQALHFEQLNAIVRRLGYAVPLTHIPFGSILGQDRQDHADPLGR